MVASGGLLLCDKIKKEYIIDSDYHDICETVAN